MAAFYSDDILAGALFMNEDEQNIFSRQLPSHCQMQAGFGKRRACWGGIFIAVLVLSVLGCTGGGGNNDLSVYLDVAADDEGHWLTAKFQNVGQSELRVWESGFWPNTFIVCRNEAGETPPVTTDAKKLLNAFAPGGPRDKNVLITLKPYQVHNGDSVLLERVFVLDPSMTYFVHVVYEERAEHAWKGKTKSNTVRIMPWKHEPKR